MHFTQTGIESIAFPIFVANGACLIQDLYFPFENLSSLKFENSTQGADMSRNAG